MRYFQFFHADRPLHRSTANCTLHWFLHLTHTHIHTHIVTVCTAKIFTHEIAGLCARHFHHRPPTTPTTTTTTKPDQLHLALGNKPPVVWSASGTTPQHHPDLGDRRHSIGDWKVFLFIHMRTFTSASSSGPFLILFFSLSPLCVVLCRTKNAKSHPHTHTLETSIFGIPVCRACAHALAAAVRNLTNVCV